MKTIFFFFLFIGSCFAAEVSVVMEKNQVVSTVTIDATAIKAEYQRKKTETGLSDAQLRAFREQLILGAVRDAVIRAHSAAEHTQAERDAELATAKAQLDADFAKRATMQPIVEVKP